MEITQILILILLFKPQVDHVHLSYLPLHYHQILYATSEIIYHSYIPLLSKLLSWHPIPTTSPHPNNCPHPLSPIPSLPPLDLTPPMTSNDFLDPNYDDTDDDYGIPLEWPPSRPMVNYQNDREFEKDYKNGWEWLEQDPGPLIAPYTGFQQCLLDPFKTRPEDFFNDLFDDNNPYNIKMVRVNDLVLVQGFKIKLI